MRSKIDIGIFISPLHSSSPFGQEYRHFSLPRGHKCDTRHDNPLYLFDRSLNPEKLFKIFYSRRSRNKDREYNVSITRDLIALKKEIWPV